MRRIPHSCLLLLCFALPRLTAERAEAQWVQQRSGVRVNLHDVAVLDSQTAIAVGQFGTILKTTDAGETWLRKNVSPVVTPRPHWNAVSFGSGELGIVVGDRLSAAVTRDGGETWSGLFVTGTPLPLRDLLSVALIGTRFVFIGSDSGYVLVSSNGGLTWSLQNLGGLPINDIFFGPVPDSVPPGYIITPSRAFKTTNFGVTWNSQPLPVIGMGYARRGDMTSDANMAYAVGADGDFTAVPTILMRAPTDTAWRRWLYTPPLPLGWLNDVSAPAAQTAFACGRILITPTVPPREGMVFKTMDAGQFWVPQYGFRRGLNAIDFLNPDRGFTVGDSGAIYFTANGGGRVINAFRLLSPGDGDTLQVGTNYRFRWERAADLDPDTTWYQVWLSTTGPGGPWTYRWGTTDTATPAFGVPSEGTYWWTVGASDGTTLAPCEDVFSFTTGTVVSAGSIGSAYEYTLAQNYPNPFNPTTDVKFSVAKTGKVRIEIYNLIGQRVSVLFDDVAEAGRYHTVRFDGSSLASGVYFYRMVSGPFTAIRKLLLLK